MELLLPKMFGAYEKPSVLILGLGETGLAMARWCARFGCRVRVADTRAEPEKLPALCAAVERAEFIGGRFLPALLDEVELLAISPGLSPSEPDTAALLELARARGIPVWGEIELFSQALACLRSVSGYAPRVLAITGTNGKTTTTRLTGLLCERAGKTVAVAGNISPAVLDKLAECIDGAMLPDVWVLELSSFQLETAQSFEADAAAVLNVSQDHLDWHGSMESYVAAKARIFSPRTVQILNRDDAVVRGMRRDDSPCSITFGAGSPKDAGAFGIARENGIDWLIVAEADDSETPLKPVRRRAAAVVELPVRIKRLMPVDALQIRGMHNAANAMAALALARAIDLPMNSLLHALRSYRGEPHRVQHVATLDDVEYFDDSKGTNVGATVAALTGLARRVVLIAGGDGKGQDFAPLAVPVARHARAVLLIGRDAPALRAALAGSGVPLHDCQSMDIAVRDAARLAEPGDAILLSPACASLDMFRNYAHRAQVFVSAVRELALERGGML